MRWVAGSCTLEAHILVLNTAKHIRHGLQPTISSRVPSKNSCMSSYSPRTAGTYRPADPGLHTPNSRNQKDNNTSGSLQMLNGTRFSFSPPFPHDEPPKRVQPKPDAETLSAPYREKQKQKKCSTTPTPLPSPKFRRPTLPRGCGSASRRSSWLWSS